MVVKAKAHCDGLLLAYRVSWAWDQLNPARAWAMNTTIKRQAAS